VRRLGLRLAIIAAGFVAMTVFSNSFASAAAYTNSRLMDDAIFDKVGSMSEQQIRDFINSRPSSCLATSGAMFPEPISYWQYGGNVDAARVIYNSAQYNGLNPQVLLATLQKEQTLITRTNCFDGSIDVRNRAIGLGCTQGQECPPAQYAGFHQQMMKGAWQLKFNKERAVGNVEWGDNGSLVYPEPYTEGNRKDCSTCTLIYRDGYRYMDDQLVKIETGATAALYRFTPHLGQSFPGIFEGWFGSPVLPTFGAKLYYQSAYPTLKAGQTATVTFSYLNSGTVLWRDERTASGAGQFPIHLATDQPINRLSPLGASWPSRSRPALIFSKVYNVVSGGVALASDQMVVNPGQIAEFTFTITAPTDMQAGAYRESFFPIREGTSSWYMSGGAWFDATVQTTYYAPNFAGQSPFPSVKAGDTANAYFDIKNSGNTTWYDSASKPVGIAPVTLATYLPVNHPDNFGAAWPGRNRPSSSFNKVFETNGTTLAANQHVAQPGQIVRFSFTFNIPVDAKTGVAREYFTPIIEGAGNWNIGGPLWQDITVQPTTFAASFVNQSAYPTIAKGSSTGAFLAIKNTGNQSWYDSASAPAGIAPAHLATAGPINRPSLFASGWVTPSRPAIAFSKVYEADGTTLASDQHTTNPGQIAKFEFTLAAPSNANSGAYREFFTPVLEGASNWNFGPMMWLDITVP
jgi:hypothetical protein